jgi:hypothetical protein
MQGLGEFSPEKRFGSDRTIGKHFREIATPTAYKPRDSRRRNLGELRPLVVVVYRGI